MREARDPTPGRLPDGFAVRLAYGAGVWWEGSMDARLRLGVPTFAGRAEGYGPLTWGRPLTWDPYAQP
jgi:hypothetical protein